MTVFTGNTWHIWLCLSVIRSCLWYAAGRVIYDCMHIILTNGQWTVSLRMLADFVAVRSQGSRWMVPGSLNALHRPRASTARTAKW